MQPWAIEPATANHLHPTLDTCGYYLVQVPTRHCTVFVTCEHGILIGWLINGQYTANDTYIGPSTAQPSATHTVHMHLPI